MTWHALEALEPAASATRQLLVPIRIRSWVVLGIVVFFISGLTGFNPSTSINLGDGAPTPMLSVPAVDIGVIGVIAILAIAVVGLGIALLFAYLGALLEFVFVDIVRTMDIRIRAFAGNRLRAGLSLLLFRIAIGVIVVGMVVGTILLTVLTAGIFLIFLILAFPVLFIIAAVLWLVGRFTIDFVVPIMIAEEVGILRGWERLLEELRTEWKQFAVYAIVRIVIGFVAAIVVWMGFAIVAIALAIPTGVVAIPVVFVLLTTVGEAAAIAIGVAVLLLFGLAVLVVGTVAVQVPVQTYVRYYALFVLASTCPTYDLLEDVRDSISAPPPSE